MENINIMHVSISYATTMLAHRVRVRCKWGKNGRWEVGLSVIVAGDKVRGRATRLEQNFHGSGAVGLPK